MSKLLTEQSIVQATLSTLDAVPFGGPASKAEITSQYLKRAVMCTLRIRTAIAQLHGLRAGGMSKSQQSELQSVIDGLSLALPEEK